MAKKGKKREKKNISAFDKRRYVLIGIISVLLIASIIWTIYSLDDAKKRRYFGLDSGGEMHPESDIQNEYFFTDDYYFKGYDDGSIRYKRGIDVSEHQGEIDWNAVKNAGVEFAFIRVGFRSSDKGIIKEDAYFRYNIRGAKENGIPVGVYFFSQAIDVNEAIDEAAFTANLIEKYDIDYPVAFDMEETNRFKDRISWLTKEEVTEISDAFCTVIENYGYESLIYTNPSWTNTRLDMSYLSDRNIWLAHYAEFPEYQYKYDIWQYSNTGSVDGISVNVDLNVMFIRNGESS